MGLVKFRDDPNHDKGLAELARLALAKTQIAAKGPCSSTGILILALEPLYAANWSGMVIPIVGAEVYERCYAFPELKNLERKLR